MRGRAVMTNLKEELANSYAMGWRPLGTPGPKKKGRRGLFNSRVVPHFMRNAFPSSLKTSMDRYIGKLEQCFACVLLVWYYKVQKRGLGINLTSGVPQLLNSQGVTAFICLRMCKWLSFVETKILKTSWFTFTNALYLNELENFQFKLSSNFVWFVFANLRDEWTVIFVI